jgi:hypothetical protein
MGSSGLFGSNGIDGIFSSLENDVNSWLGIGVTAQPSSTVNFETIALIGGGILLLVLFLR